MGGGLGKGPHVVSTCVCFFRNWFKFLSKESANQCLFLVVVSGQFFEEAPSQEVSPPPVGRRKTGPKNRSERGGGTGGSLSCSLSQTSLARAISYSEKRAPDCIFWGKGGTWRKLRRLVSIDIKIFGECLHCTWETRRVPSLPLSSKRKKKFCPHSPKV